MTLYVNKLIWQALENIQDVWLVVWDKKLTLRTEGEMLNEIHKRNRNLKLIWNQTHRENEYIL